MWKMMVPFGEILKLIRSRKYESKRNSCVFCFALHCFRLITGSMLVLKSEVAIVLVWAVLASLRHLMINTIQWLLSLIALKVKEEKEGRNKHICFKLFTALVSKRYITSNHFHWKEQINKARGMRQFLYWHVLQQELNSVLPNHSLPYLYVSFQHLY